MDWQVITWKSWVESGGTEQLSRCLYILCKKAVMESVKGVCVCAGGNRFKGTGEILKPQPWKRWKTANWEVHMEEVPARREGPAVIKHLLCGGRVLTHLGELLHPGKLETLMSLKMLLNFLVLYCFITNTLWAPWEKGIKTMVIVMMMLEGDPAYLPSPRFFAFPPANKNDDCRCDLDCVGG